MKEIDSKLILLIHAVDELARIPNFTFIKFKKLTDRLDSISARITKTQNTYSAGFGKTISKIGEIDSEVKKLK